MYPRATMIDGTRRVNPSESFSEVVASTSRTIAPASHIHGISVLLLVRLPQRNLVK